MDKIEYWDVTYILDKNKKPKKESDHSKWAEWYNNFENRRVKETWLRARRIRICSVFLGIPHEGGMFETMIWEDKNEHDNRCFRYETYEECLKDHDRLVKKLEKETK